MNDDAALLRSYADEGSEAAFAELVRRHVDLVYGAALRRTGGDPHRAADVAQQAISLSPFIQRYGPDAVRHFLLRAVPQFGDGDFSADRFAAIYEANLANGLGNL